MTAVFVETNVPSRTAESIGGWLEANAPDGTYRVVRGSGRQVDLDAFRTLGWADTMQYANMYGELDHGIQHAIVHGVTISIYDAFSPTRRYRDVSLFPSQILTDGSALPEPVYDCIRVTERVHEGFFQLPDGSNLIGDFGGEYDYRAVAFQVPMNSLVGMSGDADVNWEYVFSGVLDIVIDPEYAARAEQRREERNQQEFLSVTAIRDDGEIRNLRTRITDRTQQLTSAQTMVESNRAQLREAQELLDSVLARRTDEQTDEQRLTEYEALKRHAHITDIRIAPESMVIRTDDIPMTNPDTGETTIVGRFDLTFRFDTGEVSVHNLTNRRGNRDHPHVQDGSFCSGELNPSLMRLIQSRQIAAAANMAIAALEYVTPDDDWGRHVSWWFGAADAPEPTVDLNA